jgi:hypothetical protein
MTSSINFVIEDADGDKSIVPIDFVGAFTGDIDGLISTGWALLNPLVNGHLAGASVTLEADITGLVNSAAAAISDVQEKAEFVFNSLGGYLKRITLPTFVETLLTSSGAGKLVDVTNTDVAAFITAIESGFDDGAVTPVEINPTTSHGEDITGLKTARQAWGKNRR